MTKFICETKNLSKKYKDFYALKNVNLTIPKGEIYGLVGENGAGKTTLIRLLTGLNFKSEGEIILFGHQDNLQHERSKIGCTIEMPALYKDMTASQNLEVQRIQRGIPNKKCITDTLELIGLSNAGKKRVANALRYSDNYIEVSINQKGVFTIKNSTKSLDDIDVNLLFNKFYTVDKSRTKGSSGLGLYIVKELLKKIDGKIENVSYEKNILSISICFPLYNDKKLL